MKHDSEKTVGLDGSDEMSSKRRTRKTDYEIIPIEDFDDIKKFAKYTKWDFARKESEFEYINTDRGNRLFVCLKKG